MAEVVQGTQQEFWRPPFPVVGDDEPLSSVQLYPRWQKPALAAAREFLSGFHFCHTCGVTSSSKP